MKNIIVKTGGLCLILTIISKFSLLAQSHSDCINAYPICEMKTYHISEMADSGIEDETGQLRCFDTSFKETNSFWLQWKVIEAGTLTFVIDPQKTSDDLDFVLFRKRNAVCIDLEEVRCMASGQNLGKADQNSDTSCKGETGLDVDSMDEFEKQGCKYNDDNFLKFLMVEEGEEYVLLVNNYNSEEGFSITFEGETRLENQKDCNAFPATESLQITGLYPNPASEKIEVDFVIPNENKISLEVLDISGKLLKTISSQVTTGLNKEIIAVSELSSGTYLLRLKQGSLTTIKQFIKQ